MSESIMKAFLFCSFLLSVSVNSIDINLFRTNHSSVEIKNESEKENSCKDETSSFWIDAKTRIKDCSFVAQNIDYCTWPKIANLCPVACNNCPKCEDSKNGVWISDSIKLQTCDFVAKNLKYCTWSRVKDLCKYTCGICPPAETEAPSASPNGVCANTIGSFTTASGRSFDCADETTVQFCTWPVVKDKCPVTCDVCPCVDSMNTIWINQKFNQQGCGFVASKPWFCRWEKIKKHCPVTCNNCCKDSNGFISISAKVGIHDCAWIAKNRRYCSYDRVRNFCNKTCGLCNQTTSPTDSPTRCVDETNKIWIDSKFKLQSCGFLSFEPTFCNWQRIENHCPATCKRDTCNKTMDPTYSPSDAPSLPQPESTDCLTRINFLRSKFSLEPMTERTELHSCVNRQSEFDKQTRAHASYKRCGATGSQGQGGGSSCAEVIDRFYHERWKCTTTAVFGNPFKEVGHQSLRLCKSACMDNPRCLSFDFHKDLPNSCRFYDEGSLTHVNEIDGTLWIGAGVALTDNAPGIVDTWKSFSMIDIDGVNAVPLDGQITSFKWYGSNPNGVTFYMYRFVSGVKYKVVGMASAVSTIVGQENILQLNPFIDVKSGDVLGWTWQGRAAFGFDDRSVSGQIRYKSKENSGGPSGIGDQWDFDGGTVSRRYHVAASFVPNEEISIPAPTITRLYCAAGLCEGHCGPIMSPTTTTFAWGEWNGFYTLNWRPGATLPRGGDCPSGIEAVRCWTDESTGILWAYGVGGEDCHSTCSLAGATAGDYKCDVNTPITGGLDEVTKIMMNFENPYDGDNPFKFTCTKGTCWNGESSRQISIHEYNSDCYVPTNTQEYPCASRFLNANCFGQRFNQVCPCIPGCDWPDPNCSSTRY